MGCAEKVEFFWRTKWALGKRCKHCHWQLSTVRSALAWHMKNRVNFLWPVFNLEISPMSQRISWSLRQLEVASFGGVPFILTLGLARTSSDLAQWLAAFGCAGHRGRLGKWLSNSWFNDKSCYASRLCREDLTVIKDAEDFQDENRLWWSISFLDSTSQRMHVQTVLQVVSWAAEAPKTSAPMPRCSSFPTI